MRRARGRAFLHECIDFDSSGHAAEASPFTPAQGAMYLHCIYRGGRLMDIEFEESRTLFVWDLEKAQENLTKHDVEFTEAASVFRDPHLLIVDAARNGESRDKAIGIGGGKLLSVVHVEVDGEFIRIISAWQATPAETALYD
jgi:uncharacterized DUF497 family protein